MSSRRNRHIEMKKEPALPKKPVEMSWRDYLIMLLHIAAELEHGLMVEYLYAGYSLGGDDAAGHADQVLDWRNEILTVAREEMGHLITVQNVLLLIGGPISFEREDYPWSSPFYPFEFKLERLTLDSLAGYVYAEMPKTLTRRVDLEVRKEVMKLARPDAPTVGEVYDRIIWLIGNRKLIPDATFDPESYSRQANWDEWGRGYRPGTHQPYAKDTTTPPPHERKSRVIVTQVATRQEAVAALRDLAGQGEAEELRSGEKTEPSHFDRFARIFRAYEAILKKKRHWTPSRPVATNPYAGEPRFAPKGTTPITAKGSMLWGSLFNIRYRMLLSLLTFMFHEFAHKKRAAVLARIFGEMYNLKAIAGILARLPLGDAKKPERAGAPFQFPYTLALPTPEANFWRGQLDLLDTSTDLVGMLLDDASGDGKRYLLALRQADKDSVTWTQGILRKLA